MAAFHDAAAEDDDDDDDADDDAILAAAIRFYKHTACFFFLLFFSRLRRGGNSGAIRAAADRGHSMSTDALTKKSHESGLAKGLPGARGGSRLRVRLAQTSGRKPDALTESGLCNGEREHVVRKMCVCVK